MKKKGFTLVELLAVIAILAVILLISVPQILRVIEDSKEKTFRDSVLSLFHIIEMDYMETGNKEGRVPNLNLNSNRFLTGTYTIEPSGDIVLNQVCDGSYKASVVYNQTRENFEVEKDNGTCDVGILVLGKNPETLSCSSTKLYTDQGAKYKEQTIASTDTVDLKKAGTYEVHYTYEDHHTTRIVNVTNDHTPSITLTQEEVTIYQGDTFDATRYIASASDECEGDITSKVQSTSNVLTDVEGTYEVVYKVKNLGEKEGSKTLTITVKELPEVELVMPSVDGSNGWYKTSQTITVNYDNTILDSYEYAISTDNGNTYGEYVSTTETSFSLNINSANIKIKVRGKRGSKYSELVVSDTLKMDTVTPSLTGKVASYTMNQGESYQVTNLYNVTYGVSSGTTTCQVGSTEVTNLNTLGKGTHTLTCTATSTAGKNSSSIQVSLTIQYAELILNGANPVYKGDLIPVTISSDGTVKRADMMQEWYNYSKKQWANAVILMDKNQTYNTGDTIPESNIESYFVWIPRYKYQIFDEGNYSGLTETQESTPQQIKIVFENKTVTPSTGSHVGEWLTHPAFTSFDVNGLWVGKFELGYNGASSTTDAQVNSNDSTKIIVKPNVYSWRSNSIKNSFEAMYNYNRNLDSHMMKNTEWGAVAYLFHSKYGQTDATGKNVEIGINNNSYYVTGCGDAAGSGTSTTCNVYTSAKGFLASTTGNITGIYDMSGCGWELVAAHLANTYGDSGFDATNIAIYNQKYFDIVPNGSDGMVTYQYRTLGDATGELGPFYGPVGTSNYRGWYNDYARWVGPSYPWVARGGSASQNTAAGIFFFDRFTGVFASRSDNASRLVLAFQ